MRTRIFEQTNGLLSFQRRNRSLLAELPLPSWDISRAVTGSSRNSTWLATPLTCGIPCVACYDGIVLPFHYSQEVQRCCKYDVDLHKAQKRLSPILRAVRSLLRRAESLDLVLEAELCWPTLSMKTSLAQCIHAVISDDDSSANEKILNATKLHILDVLPSLSPKTLFHRQKTGGNSIDGCFAGLFCPTHSSSELFADAQSPMSERRSVLWQLFFGREYFSSSAVYCSHYRKVRSVELTEGGLAELFYSNRVRRRNAFALKHEENDAHAVYNAIRIVEAATSRVDCRPSLQYSPRVFLEDVEITEKIRSYFLKCRNAHGLLFDVVHYPSEEHSSESVPGDKLQIVHFGHGGVDGKPLLAIENPGIGHLPSHEK